MWRQGEACGVVYTEDREHLQRLLALDWFPVKREEDVASYKNRRGRVFAWQASFSLSLWTRVVRALGREEIEIEKEVKPRVAGEGKSRPMSAAPVRAVTAPARPQAAAACPAPTPAKSRAARGQKETPDRVAQAPVTATPSPARRTASAATRSTDTAIPGPARPVRPRDAGSSSPTTAPGNRKTKATDQAPSALAAGAGTPRPEKPGRASSKPAEVAARAPAGTSVKKKAPVPTPPEPEPRPNRARSAVHTPSMPMPSPATPSSPAAARRGRTDAAEPAAPAPKVARRQPSRAGEPVSKSAAGPARQARGS
jgi:hypothetical protein